MHSFSTRVINARKIWIRSTCIALALLAVQYANGSTTGSQCRYMNYGTLAIKFRNFSPTIEGRINGSPSAMLIDTGSVYTALTRKETERLGLRLSPVKSINLAGIGGESSIYEVQVDEMSIGGVKWDRANRVVIGDIGDEFPYGALIGADFLFYRDVELFLANREIRFFKSDGCADAFLAYWSGDASDVSLEKMSSGDHRQVVTVEINGQKMRALIDSGAQTSAIDLAAAARLGITPRSDGVIELPGNIGIGKRKIKSWLAPFKSFSIGNETISNPKISIIDLYGAAHADSERSESIIWKDDETEMILGADFLRAHRVLFAVSQHRLYFSYLGGNVFDLTSSMDDDKTGNPTQ
jgi:predicted aspartyl protease